MGDGDGEWKKKKKQIYIYYNIVWWGHVVMRDYKEVRIDSRGSS